MSFCGKISTAEFPDIQALLILLYRTFDFKEKVELQKYYPQFYHKTDKVGDNQSY